ncbi:Type-2 restriction enzyme BslI subunit alpha [subsurface metagenome]
MEINMKSISHALTANGVHVYLSVKLEYLVGNRLVCQECQEPWYMNLTECFMCGSINPFLYQCNNEDCKQYISITNAGKKCTFCNMEGTLHQECPNQNCFTNVNTELKVAINNLGGTFNKNSGFSISQQYCLNCGSQYHNYQTRVIYPLFISEETKKIRIEEIKKEVPLDSLAYFVLVLYSKNKRKYYAMKIVEVYQYEKLDLSKLNFTNEFSKIVDQIFSK